MKTIPDLCSVRYARDKATWKSRIANVADRLMAFASLAMSLLGRWTNSPAAMMATASNRNLFFSANFLPPPDFVDGVRRERNFPPHCVQLFVGLPSQFVRHGLRRSVGMDFHVGTAQSGV